MKKRVLSLLLAFTLLLTAGSFSALAAEEPDAGLSSTYISSCNASLTITGTSGELDLVYSMFAPRTMVTLGVQSITVRNNSGSIHSIIFGSTANGLLATNTWHASGSYSLNLTSGNIYYCTVAFVARDANGKETAKVVTSRVTCP